MDENTATMNCDECRRLGMEEARGCKPGQKGADELITIGKAIAIYDRCTKAYLRDADPGVRRLVGDAFFFEVNKVLPCAGGLLDQPSKFIDALAIVGKVRSDAEQ